MAQPQLDFTAEGRRLIKEVCDQYELNFVEHDTSVDLDIRIPKQQGLDFDIYLSYQNLDEMWISVEEFRVCYFPCQIEPNRSYFIETLAKLITGEVRIVFYYFSGKYFKSLMQFLEGGDWINGPISSRMTLFGFVMRSLWKNRIEMKTLRNL